MQNGVIKAFRGSSVIFEVQVQTAAFKCKLQRSSAICRVLMQIATSNPKTSQSPSIPKLLRPLLSSINTAIDLCKSLIHLSLQDKEANLDLGTLLSGVKEGCLVEDLEIRTICLKFLFCSFAYDLVQVENFEQLFSQHFFPLFDLVFLEGDASAAFEEEFCNTTLMSAYKYFALLVNSCCETKEMLSFPLMIGKYFLLIERSLGLLDENIVKMGLYCLREGLQAKKIPFLSLSASAKQRLFGVLVDLYQQEQFHSLYSASIAESIDGLFEFFSMEEAFSLACLFDAVPFCLVKYQMAKRLVHYHSQLLEDVIERAFAESARNMLIPQILRDFLAGNCPIGEDTEFLTRAVLKFVLGAEHCPLPSSAVEYREVISMFLQRQLGLE